jgi:hypothetical protein
MPTKNKVEPIEPFASKKTAYRWLDNAKAHEVRQAPRVAVTLSDHFLLVSPTRASVVPIFYRKIRPRFTLATLSLCTLYELCTCKALSFCLIGPSSMKPSSS